MSKPSEIRPPGRGARGVIRTAIATLVTSLGLIIASPCPAIGAFEGAQYTFGRGLRLPALNLTLSGYSSLRAQDLARDEARFGLRDLSLFAIWDALPHWQLFSEIELENTFSVDDRGLHASDTEAEIERLYLDHEVSDALTVRGGRYLTPFGRWNLLHADPLVWSVSRPLVTSLIVPDHGTGIAVYGQRSLNANTLDYHVYLDDSDDLDPHHGESGFEDIDLPGFSNDFDNAAGVQLRYHFLGDRAQIGASFASFRLHRSDGRHHVFGLDAMVRWRRIELSMESAYGVSGDSREDAEWGSFVQGVVPLAGRLYAVMRTEFYSSGSRGPDANRQVIGLAFRPHAATTFKFEYHGGSDRTLAPDGWEASWSVLF